LQRGNVPHAPGIDQKGKCWELTRVHHWGDYLPIRGIPTHEQQFLRDRFSHWDCGGKRKFQSGNSLNNPTNKKPALTPARVLEN
jgi:hypothetical protein